MSITSKQTPIKQSAEGLPEIVGVETRVPLYDGSLARYVNLDSAASTPAFSRVQQVVNDFLPWYSSVHRGAGYKSRLSTQLYEQAREVVLRFTGANPLSHDVLFVRNTTEALNLLAHRITLRPGELVLTTRLEHHSNLLPWYRRPHELVELTPEGRIDFADLERRLVQHQGRVRLVTLSGASNVTGLLPDVQRAARLAHAHGALIAVDAAQLAPHRTLTMETPDPAERLDILAFSGHKLYAPYGAGVLIIPEHLFAEGEPMLVGGGAVCLVTRAGVTWASGHDLEEAGSPNVLGVVALASALETLMRTGMERVAAHERSLTNYTVRRLREVPGLHLYGPSWDDVLTGREDRLGVFAFSLEGHSYVEVAAILAYEWAVGVRSGCFCSHQYVAHLLGITEDEAQNLRDLVIAGQSLELPGMVRASISLASTTADIDRLIEGLQAIAHGQVRGSYLHTSSGDLEPADAASIFATHALAFL